MKPVAEVKVDEAMALRVLIFDKFFCARVLAVDGPITGARTSF